jgi:LysM repeat protein
MNRKPTNLVLMIFLVLAIALAGCRRSAAPPLEELTPEDEEAAAMQEAEENTATMEADESEEDEAAEAEETAEATEEPTATEEAADETPEPTPEPTETATPEPTQAPTTAGTTHVVQPGENLFRIALQYGTTVDTLAKANNITNPSVIYVGQKLTIPSGSTSPTPSPGVKTYVVQPGDNLFRIALRHNYDQYYLARYNGIENPSMIYVGQVIRIP